MRLISELINRGFVPFRKIGNEYIPCKNPFEFSTLSPGKIDVRLILEDKEIVIGLLVKGYPPTLISPYLGDHNIEIEKKLNLLSVDDILSHMMK